MIDEEDWASPDGAVSKTIIVKGMFGPKPTEDCVCNIKVASCHVDVKSFNEGPVTIGQMDTTFGKILEKCLVTMNIGEISNMCFQLQCSAASAVVELKSFKSNGQVYEWDAKRKYKLAMKHKNRGVELFKMDYVDASHRFGKAIKLLTSIPIEVEDPPDVVDGVAVADVYSLKTNLYNNLASCYMKHCEFETAIDLCKKVLAADQDNVKALYKLGVAYDEVHSYDKAYDILKKLVGIDPANKAAAERLKGVVVNVNDANAKVNAMVKKMFV